MDWTITEGYGIPIGSSFVYGAPKEVSLVSFTLHLRAFTRKQLYRRLQQAYASGSLKLGRVDELFDDDPGSNEMNQSQKGLAQFLIPRSNASKLFELIE